MKNRKRVFLIVLDSFGIGAAPDAGDFGDANANTLKSISTSERLNIPNLINMGLGNIEGVSCIGKSGAPIASYGRLKEISRGKDTTVGHWELMGILSSRPLPTYPNGFPEEVIAEFERRADIGVLCNLPYSGTEVIKDYGEEHLKSGKLIVYTSADSVFQIAAHEDTVPTEKLYEYCRIARNLLAGEHGVGRVIARPFAGEIGNFKRTANRKDFSLTPPSDTALDAIKRAGKDVIAIGKITDIFASKGITRSTYTHSNREGIEETIKIMKEDFEGLCFTNLVDFDMIYGHRQDKDGYAQALSYFDSRLPELVRSLKGDDLLIITADHGCDPADNSTDHTREYVPCLIYGKDISPKDIGTKDGFFYVGKTVCEALDIDASYIFDNNYLQTR